MVDVIIKVPKKVWNTIERNEEVEWCGIEMADAVKNGIPLPKGHGRLIDADAFIEHLKNTSKTYRYNEFIIDKKLTGLTVDDVFKAIIESLQNEGLANGDTPTVIEAENEKQNMTIEEKQKAINALKISVPIMAVTYEEFNDYIQSLNKIMDWLEKEPCKDTSNND